MLFCRFRIVSALQALLAENGAQVAEVMVSQACTGIADMAALQSVLAAMYSFIQLSPTRLERFKEMAAVLAVDTLKFKRIYEIRYSLNF